jgi:hypothetical protein
MINAPLAHLTDFVDGKPTVKAVRFNRWCAHGL